MARKEKIPAVRLTIDNDQSNQNSNEQIDNYLPLNDSIVSQTTASYFDHKSSISS